MAGKIYVTGDMHRRYTRFNVARFPLQKKLDKEDYVIVCGDFGLIWDNPQNDETESKEEKWWLDWMEGLPFSILFVDGNHENFDRLYRYPIDEWNGGKVHKIRPSVIHLMRGQVFDIAGKKIFTFGGARSHDISAGILEPDDPDIKTKIKQLNDVGAQYRINHISWWKEEMPNSEEMEEGKENLAKHGNKVDYIITHCCPGQLHKIMDERLDEQNELTELLDSIRNECEYQKWYFGHYHDDKTLTERDVLLYHRIIEIGCEVDDSQPVPGKPRYKKYQPVKFEWNIKDETMHLVGIIVIVDAYGTYEAPEEPSYDIYSCLNVEEQGVFKHISESNVQPLSEEEAREHSEILTYLATH